jgi:hypothetical protein
MFLGHIVERAAQTARFEQSVVGGEGPVEFLARSFPLRRDSPSVLGRNDPKAWAIRKIGALPRNQMAAVVAGLRDWLGLAQD